MNQLPNPTALELNQLLNRPASISDRPHNPYEQQNGQPLQLTPNQLFDIPKPENDPDLLVEVISILTHKLPYDIATVNQILYDTFYSHRFIQDCAGRHSNIQRQMLNLWFNLQLSLFPVHSATARFALIPDGNHGEWLRLIDEMVLPFMNAYQLPKPVA